MLYLARIIISLLLHYSHRLSALFAPTSPLIIYHTSCWSYPISHNIKLGNDFLCILKLPADGKGFIIWKERLELSIHAHGLYGHLDGTMTRPDDPPMRPEGSTLTVEEASSNEWYTGIEPIITGTGHSIPTDCLDYSQLSLLEDKRETDHQESLGCIKSRFWKEIAHDHNQALKAPTWYMLQWEWQYPKPFWQHTYYEGGTC